MKKEKEILAAFKIEKDAVIVPTGSGHINDTYCVTLHGSTQPNYILQHINHFVFHDIAKLSENIQRVTNHLHENGNNRYQVMTLVPSKNESLWVQSSDGNYWRLYTYIPNSFTFDLAPNKDFAFEAGQAYGWFIRTLDSIKGSQLHEVIPGFHNLGLRISQLKNALGENKVKRAKSCHSVIDFYFSRCSEMLEFDQLVGTKEIPLRITHNDTKINNVLFNAQNRAISIIDLDTVMPGVVHYDFGDAIRTIASATHEDETRLELVGINIELYKGFTGGFLTEIGSCLTTTELAYLPKAPRMMAFIMGIRFLADYLRGDNYYKVSHKEHNIERARNQMALIIDMEKKSTEMGF
jgi:Ser/Thr protein kinase RdoA (MazF antagonist)